MGKKTDGKRDISDEHILDKRKEFTLTLLKKRKVG
jgi:hypothetical protein